MPTINGLILRTDGTVDEIVLENQLEALQGAVGGYIEVLRIGPDADLIINEEGKLDGLAPNKNATLVARAMVGVAPDDFIAGDALIFGFRGGEFTNVPSDIRMAVQIATAQPGVRVVK